MDYGTLKIIFGFVAAIVAAGLVFKFVVRNKSKKTITKESGSVTIKDSNVGGDVAGRDLSK